MAKIVNTDNFGEDYPNEKFVENLPVLSAGQATLICDAINRTQPDNAPRFFKVVADDYQLQPGFEP